MGLGGDHEPHGKLLHRQPGVRLILDDPRQVAEIARVFEADWEGERLDLSRALLVWSPSRTLGGVKEGNAREVLLGLIRGAKRELFLEHQAMADPEVVEALKEALSRGVRVRLLGSLRSPGTPTSWREPWP